jgi:hypothetical protein
MEWTRVSHDEHMLSNEDMPFVAPIDVPPKDGDSAFYQVFRIRELAEQILIPGDAMLEDLLERRLACELFNDCICGLLESYKRENQVGIRKFAIFIEQSVLFMTHTSQIYDADMLTAPITLYNFNDGTRLNPYVDRALCVHNGSQKPHFFMATLGTLSNFEQPWEAMTLTRPPVKTVHLLIPSPPIKHRRESRLDDEGNPTGESWVEVYRYVAYRGIEIEKTVPIRQAAGLTLADLVAGVRRELRETWSPFIILLDRKHMRAALNAMPSVYYPHFEANRPTSMIPKGNSKRRFNNQWGYSDEHRVWSEELKAWTWPWSAPGSTGDSREVTARRGRVDQFGAWHPPVNPALRPPGWEANRGHNEATFR